MVHKVSFQLGTGEKGLEGNLVQRRSVNNAKIPAVSAALTTPSEGSTHCLSEASTTGTMVELVVTGASVAMDELVVTGASVALPSSTRRRWRGDTFTAFLRRSGLQRGTAQAPSKKARMERTRKTGSMSPGGKLAGPGGGGRSADEHARKMVAGTKEGKAADELR